jgi:uncharacterized protein YecT (DUF1311 family)
MKTLVSLTLVFLTSGAAYASFSSIASYSGSFSFGEDVEISIESKLEPPEAHDPLPGLRLGSGRLTDRRGIARFSANPTSHEYFGYDLRVDALDAAAGTYRITFSALSLTPDEMKLADGAAWRSLPPPAFPLPQTVQLWDTIALTLFENPSTGQKIVDYIKLRRHNCDSESAGAKQIACLNNLVEDEQKSLTEESARISHDRDAATATAIRESQPIWEKYRDAACANLATEAKRLHCKLELTRSRTHEVRTMY